MENRHTARLKDFDYSSNGAYFLTICTKNRRCMLSKIVGTGVPDCPQLILTKYGQIAEKYILELNDFYDHISIKSYVIMPNHIHLLVVTEQQGQSGTPVPTSKTAKANSLIPSLVSTFKRFCNRHYNENIWQNRYYDHIIRDSNDYTRHLQYICENPIRWYDDRFFVS